MQIAELLRPGTWVDHPNRQDAFELENLLCLLEGNLAEANLALLLFEQQRAVVARDAAPSADDWQREGEERRAVEQRLEAELPPMSFDEQWQARERIRFEAEREVARNRWARGDLPRGLRHRLPFLYARAFVYALDNIGKALDAIDAQPVPTGAAAARNTLERAVPDLIGVRNTAHHHEDRVRQLDHRGKRIQLQPVDAGGIKAANGALVLDSLNDNRYGCTLSEGRCAEIEVSEGSLLAARDAIQQVLNSVKWKGPPRLLPM